MIRLLKLIKENTDWLSKQNDKQYSLQFDKYRKEQEMISIALLNKLKLLTKLKDELNVSALPDEANRWANDKDKQERFNQWLKELRTDIYLDQAVKVMDDMISQQNLAKSKSKLKTTKKLFNIYLIYQLESAGSLAGIFFIDIFL